MLMSTASAHAPDVWFEETHTLGGQTQSKCTCNSTRLTDYGQPTAGSSLITDCPLPLFVCRALPEQQLVVACGQARAGSWQCCAAGVACTLLYWTVPSCRYV